MFLEFLEIFTLSKVLLSFIELKVNPLNSVFLKLQSRFDEQRDYKQSFDFRRVSIDRDL